MPLPPEWVAKESKSHKGRKFYYNKLTRQARWEKPPMVEDEDYPEINIDESQKRHAAVDPYLEDLNACLNDGTHLKNRYVARHTSKRRKMDSSNSVPSSPSCSQQPPPSSQQPPPSPGTKQPPVAAQVAPPSKYTPPKTFSGIIKSIWNVFTKPSSDTQVQPPSSSGTKQPPSSPGTKHPLGSAHVTPASKYTPPKTINETRATAGKCSRSSPSHLKTFSETRATSGKCSRSSPSHLKTFSSTPLIKPKSEKKIQININKTELEKGLKCKNKMIVRDSPYGKFRPDWKHKSSETTPKTSRIVTPTRTSRYSGTGSASSILTPSIAPSPSEPEEMEVDVEPMEAISSVMTIRKRGVKECGKSFDEVDSSSKTNKLNDNKITDAIDVVVIDTNVLISHLNLLISILRKSSGQCFVIPWIVIQELDGLKECKKSDVACSARQSIKYLLEQKKRGTERLKFEPSHVSPHTETPDDRVVSCLHWAKKIFNGRRTMLLSNDNNLCLKALIHSYESFTVTDFQGTLAVTCADYLSQLQPFMHSHVIYKISLKFCTDV